MSMTALQRVPDGPVEEALLTAERVNKSFGPVRAVVDVDLALRPGEVVGLAGENGSGKSTLILTIAGMHTADSGTVRVGDLVLPSGNPRAARGLPLGSVTQEGSLHPDLSVAENIYLGRGHARGATGIDWRRTHARAGELLSRLGLDIDPRATVGALPSDQRQLVEIARAISIDARVLLLDEATSSLDHVQVEHLFRVVRRLRDQGVAVVFVSHRMAELAAVCDRIVVLRDGVRVAEDDASAVDERWLLRHMVGRDIDIPESAGGSADGPVCLEVRGLSDREGRLHDVSLSVREGEIVALAGLVGAGRTELLETIAGVRPRAHGSVLLGGEPLGTSPAATLSQRVALLPEDRKVKGLVATMSVSDNLLLRPERWLRRLRDRRAEHRCSGDWVERLGIRTAGVGSVITSLSGGNQQKVLLARYLNGDPRLLLLDEPTRGVDIGAKAEIAETIRRVVTSGMAVLMASSELPEVLSLATRVLVMRDGRIVAELTGSGLTEEDIIDHAVGVEEEDRV